MSAGPTGVVMDEQPAGEPPPASGGIPVDKLRRSAAQGAKWNFLSLIMTQGGRLTFSLVLARLLGPESFGIMAQGMLYVGLTMLVLDQGFAVALVQRKVLDPRDVGAVRVLNFLAGVTMTIGTILAAPAIADFFHTPQLTTVLRVLSASVLIKSFQIVPRAMVRRNMLWRSSSVVNVIAMVVGGVVGIVAAVAGADYWSLVVQTIVTDVVAFFGLRVILPKQRSPILGTFANLRAMWGFSIGVLGTRFLSFFGGNFDNLLIGRYESASRLALYALSYRLLKLPLEMIGGVVNNVALPVFSKLQDDDERLRAWFLQSTGLVAMVAYPILVLLSIGAEEGVPVAFGEQWTDAAGPLQILSLAGLMTVVRMLMTPMAQAKGRTDLVFWWALGTFGLQGVAFLIGVQYGIVGVAVAYAVVHAVTMPLNIAHFGRFIGMSMREYVAVLVPPFCGVVVMAAVWQATSMSLRQIDGLPILVRLGIASAVALPVYVGTIRFLWPTKFATARNLLATMAKRG